jgi:hypothetical protein
VCVEESSNASERSPEMIVKSDPSSSLAFRPARRFGLVGAIVGFELASFFWVIANHDPGGVLLYALGASALSGLATGLTAAIIQQFRRPGFNLSALETNLRRAAQMYEQHLVDDVEYSALKSRILEAHPPTRPFPNNFLGAARWGLAAGLIVPLLILVLEGMIDASFLLAVSAATVSGGGIAGGAAYVIAAWRQRQSVRQLEDGARKGLTPEV